MAHGGHSHDVRIADERAPPLAHALRAMLAKGISDDLDICSISSPIRLPRHSSWMLSRLTNETKDRHIGIDEGLFASFASPSTGAYRHFLARMYGFSAPVGTALLATPGFDAELLVTRVRTGWIASDLLGLGITGVESAMLQRRIDVPVFGSGAEALGWLYVSERITLRHELIRNQLLAKLPETFAIASDYLMTTSGRAHQQWAELGRALDRAACSDEVCARILDGADAAFAVQQKWIDSTEYDGF